jgi:hypothetical protein
MVMIVNQVDFTEQEDQLKESVAIDWFTSIVNRPLD